MNIQLTNEQARRFLLLKHGLLGDHRFHGEAGVLDFVRQAGCIQFDPIDICGKNHELVLQSRVKGFTKKMLGSLLYSQRKLVDHFDKNMAIFPVEDWPYFARNTQRALDGSRSRDEVTPVLGEIRRIIAEQGAVCSSDLKFSGSVNWSWAPTTLSRAGLETLYFQGELLIHHKKGTIRYFDFAEKLIPADILHTADPNPTEEAYHDWHLLRRINSVGLLWNKASDALLCIRNFSASKRWAAFQRLLADGRLQPVSVDGIKEPLYLLSQDLPLLERILSDEELTPRTELIAPLDNLLWDRKLIKALFDFDYKWEIYTPLNQRKYGYYVLPVLQGDRFVARAELVRDKKAGVLTLQHLWKEQSMPVTEIDERGLLDCYSRLASLHELKYRGTINAKKK